AYGVFFIEDSRGSPRFWVGGWWVAACLRSEDLSELFSKSSLLAVRDRDVFDRRRGLRDDLLVQLRRSVAEIDPEVRQVQGADVPLAVAAFDRQVVGLALLFPRYRRSQNPHVPFRAMEQDLRRHCH